MAHRDDRGDDTIVIANFGPFRSEPFLVDCRLCLGETYPKRNDPTEWRKSNKYRADKNLTENDSPIATKAAVKTLNMSPILEHVPKSMTPNSPTKAAVESQMRKVLLPQCPSLWRQSFLSLMHLYPLKSSNHLRSGARNKQVV